MEINMVLWNGQKKKRFTTERSETPLCGDTEKGTELRLNNLPCEAPFVRVR
ncbi:hypothetical protein ABI_02580 [Asticcacaulis biprosthecium C19]|uniref:Uncharacterized protein n=1 Tax=Asticcacaulis biprosthecium C19 TaxID=715226 RepID=F4QIR7_9CAUL|nr:hypothetical protein ABI_02580 [Asticcacaulis biprosthecium C19]